MTGGRLRLRRGPGSRAERRLGRVIRGPCASVREWSARARRRGGAQVFAVCVARRPRRGAADNARCAPDNRSVRRSSTAPAENTSDSRTGSRNRRGPALRFTCEVPSCSVYLMSSQTPVSRTRQALSRVQGAFRLRSHEIPRLICARSGRWSTCSARPSPPSTSATSAWRCAGLLQRRHDPSSAWSTVINRGRPDLSSSIKASRRLATNRVRHLSTTSDAPPSRGLHIRRALHARQRFDAPGGRR
ncbi:hypothetical protein SAMN05421507_13128 [Lentzea jiangxiensis]|uniref:Uncharacterized protein n=1 Tax=Lentzea jiangxiensis TaxID=641025 RepID=A0A1H0X419_9PSEU|nr:hypothetical protein SAMN05421507_13128 [Lentzea jiangxiensis]